MKKLSTYENGNYIVTIYNDGTKIRETEEDEFISYFPESIDMKITNKCDIGCKYCHEDSSINGEHGDILNIPFIDTLRPYTELALGGGNILCHPDLVSFLHLLKDRNIIANITVNQIHFTKEHSRILQLSKEGLINGVGVSLVSPTSEFIELIKKTPNAVVHVINGIVTLQGLQTMYNNNIKLLILGYKEFRRGKTYYSKEIEKSKECIYNNICTIIKKFRVVSFDNLAVEQLNIKRILSRKQWEEFYMGDDGKFTMYIDLVSKQFAINSTALIRYPISDSIDNMFSIIKRNNS